MTLEIECKIPISSRPALASALAALGATDDGDRDERNWVFDTPDQRLYAQHMLLRLRTDSREPGALMTVKRPSAEAGFKSREEYEVRLDDVEDGRAALSALGYEEVWYYEKRRHYWQYLGCSIALDDVPELGAFIEVEGPEAAQVQTVLAALKLDPDTHVNESYLSLFARHCADRGDELRDMRFSDETDSTCS